MSWIHRTFNPKIHKQYKPVNITKYKSKYFPIIRSDWELAFCKFLDFNNNILEWSSENVEIPYVLKGKKRKYYPDFLIKIKSSHGVNTWLIEIKPFKETVPPKQSPRKSAKTLITERLTWEKNVAKWQAALKYCNQRGWSFKRLTEKELFGRK